MGFKARTAGLLPAEHGIHTAAADGHICVLEWMTRLESPVLSGQGNVKSAPAHEHGYIIEWMEGVLFPAWRCSMLHSLMMMRQSSKVTFSSDGHLVCFSTEGPIKIWR